MIDILKKVRDKLRKIEATHKNDKELSVQLLSLAVTIDDVVDFYDGVKATLPTTACTNYKNKAGEERAKRTYNKYKMQ